MTLPKHFYRVQGFANPEDHHTLFDIYFTSWGVQTRIIRALFAALAAHVRTHYDPNAPADERDAELEDILSRVSFGRPLRSPSLAKPGHGRGDGPRAVARAPGNDPFSASGSPATPPEPRPGVREPSGAADAQEGPPDAKEAHTCA